MSKTITKLLLAGGSVVAALALAGAGLVWALSGTATPSTAARTTSRELAAAPAAQAASASESEDEQAIFESNMEEAAAAANNGSGIVVAALDADGPAAKAGLLRGDVILKVNSAVVDDPRALADAIATKNVGDKVSLDFTRGHSTQTLDVTLAARNNRPYLGISAAGGGRRTQGRGLPFTHTLPFTASISLSTRVISVTAGSPAEKAGLKTGDLIIKVDGTEASDPRALASQIASKKPGNTVKLTVQRNGTTVEIEATLGENPSDKSKSYLGVQLAPGFGPGRPQNAPGGKGPKGTDDGRDPSKRTVPGQRGPGPQDSPASNL